MSNEELSQEELEQFLSAIDHELLRYKWMLRFKGYKVDDESIRLLEKEIYPDIEALEGKSAVPLHQKDLDELQLLLAIQDPPPNNGPLVTKAVLYKLERTSLRMRKEANHGRPHFHIEYKNEYRASYAVDTLEKLAGHVPQKYETPLLVWAATHKASLLLTWDKLQAGENVVELIATTEDA